MAGAVVVLVGLVGWLRPGHRSMPPLVAGAGYLIAAIVAGLEAWIRVLRGELVPVWEPSRRELADARGAPPP